MPLLNNNNGPHNRWPYLFILCFCACVLVQHYAPQGLVAQTIPFTLQNDSLLANRSLSFGFDKTGNTVLFHADAYGALALPYGSLFFKQKYSGRAIRTNTLSVRDDEEFAFLWSIPVSTNVDVSASGSLLSSSDPKATNTSDVQDIAAFGGIHLRPLANTKINLGAGGVHSSQLGTAEKGWRLIGSGTMQDTEIDHYVLNADARGEYSLINNKREIAHSVLSAHLAREFGTGEQLAFTARFATLHRDQYLPVPTIGTDSTIVNRLSDSIETRGEQQLSFIGMASLPLFSAGTIDLTASVEQVSADRYYHQLLSTLRESGVMRTHNELRFSLASTARFLAFGGEHEIAVRLESREEHNTVARRFGIGDTALSAQRLRETLRDNSSARSSLSARSRWWASTNDTLHYTVSTSLLRYDTPSNENNDDRDELTAASSISYGHNFSPLLSASLTAEIQLTHIVFLKAARSAQNNWNRIVKMTPAIAIRGKRFSATPRFEVVANYTTFDFEDIIGSRQSISSRQIGYTDSIAYKISDRHRIESRFTVRYEERGEFRWTTFSEIPNYRKIEQFYTVLFFVDPSPAISLGAGGRYYQLTQQVLGRTPPLDGDLSRQAVGPETTITATLPSGTTLRLHGWYEIQFARGNETRRLPNILLNVFVPL